jgi:hypothetical protein
MRKVKLKDGSVREVKSPEDMEEGPIRDAYCEGYVAGMTVAAALVEQEEQKQLDRMKPIKASFHPDYSPK